MALGIRRSISWSIGKRPLTAGVNSVSRTRAVDLSSLSGVPGRINRGASQGAEGESEERTWSVYARGLAASLVGERFVLDSAELNVSARGEATPTRRHEE
jgi:hypothetical protein